jgi:fructokinase
VGLGELTWDLLPDGKQLGGAPANFAYISHLLGDESVVASRVGNDDLASDALRRLERMGISTEFVQSDSVHPTGTVGVEIGERGEPIFCVNQNSAWDYLEWTESWKALAARVDIVSFGSMAQRHDKARETIIRFVENTRTDALRLFDINLRHSFFNSECLAKSLELADVVKLNQEELAVAAELLSLASGDELSLSRQLIERFDLDLVAITRAENGSLLITAEDVSEHPGFQVEVKDTIGAGDAFGAGLAHYFWRGASLGVIGEAANRMGSWVASEKGATPEVNGKWRRNSEW